MTLFLHEKLMFSRQKLQYFLVFEAPVCSFLVFAWMLIHVFFVLDSFVRDNCGCLHHLVLCAFCISCAFITCYFPFRVRFHYGHPDVFDRLFHLARGGVSKASKTINLSEDIFAGMLILSSSLLINVSSFFFFFVPFLLSAGDGRGSNDIAYFVALMIAP